MNEGLMPTATAARSLPPGACDCHMHVYGGPGSVAAPFPIPTANAAGYRLVMKRLKARSRTTYYVLSYTAKLAPIAALLWLALR